MSLEKHSPCKVNLVLNILRRRPDGYHELETVMQPIPLHDQLVFERAGQGIQFALLGTHTPDRPPQPRVPGCNRLLRRSRDH